MSHKVLIMQKSPGPHPDFHTTFSEMLGQLKLISMGRPRITFCLRLHRAKFHIKQVFEAPYVQRPQLLAFLNSLNLNILHVIFLAKSNLSYFINIYLYFSCMYVRAPHACLVSMEAREGIKFPGTRVSDGYEIPWVLGVDVVILYYCDIDPWSSVRAFSAFNH